MDNIYVLNYLINKAGEQKERAVVTMFVDFKATFDSVERKVRKERKVVRAIRDRRVRERLVKSVRRCYGRQREG